MVIYDDTYRNVILSYMVWLTLTRTLKLMPHIWNHPGHIIYVPAFIAFGYYFAIMKLYALLTLHEVNLPRVRLSLYHQLTPSLQVGWGTRAGIGGATEALNAMNEQEAKGGASSGLATPAEKFGGSQPGFPSYPTDDGRRYDPEALNYNQNAAPTGYAR